MKARLLFLGLACAALGIGGAYVAAPRVREAPASVPPLGAPRVARLSKDSHLVRSAVPDLRRDSVERRVNGFTIRVRNLSCEGLSTGSGFAVSTDVLVTNRHVLAGAESLEINTADGRSLVVADAAVARLGDIGLVLVQGKVAARVAATGPEPTAGQRVHAVGYPLGGELTFTPLRVIDFVDGVARGLGVPGRVMRLTHGLRPGNSGGPVVDTQGRVVAIAYAEESATRYSLAIPLSTMERLIASGGYESVPPCGSP